MPCPTPAKNSPVPPSGTTLDCARPSLPSLPSVTAFSRFPPDFSHFPDNFSPPASRHFVPPRLRSLSLKPMALKPEKIRPLPEDQQLMPENEPEKNLKIQLPFSPRLSASPSRSLRLNPPRFLGHSHISIQNLRP